MTQYLLSVHLDEAAPAPSDEQMQQNYKAETKEQLGGFWVINAADRASALDWAAKGSAACGGPVEVRAFQEIPED